jgi:hypothetical protein
MVKVVGLKRQITELPACASNVTQNSIKVKISAKNREWRCGKKPTGELLPNYSSRGCYIPDFKNMTFELTELQSMLYDYSQFAITP